jgi:hypothetical protein
VTVTDLECEIANNSFVDSVREGRFDQDAFAALAGSLSRLADEWAMREMVNKATVAEFLIVLSTLRGVASRSEGDFAERVLSALGELETMMWSCVVAGDRPLQS